MNSVLFVPSNKKGNGSGHIARCFAMASALNKYSRQAKIGATVVFKGDAPSCKLYIDAEATAHAWSADEIRLAYTHECETVGLVSTLNPGERFDLIVLDRRASSQGEFLRWSAYGTVVAIDEEGAPRSMAPYLVDILPRPALSPPRKGRSSGLPNFNALGLLALPQNRRQSPDSFKRVLVTFGGEDPGKLAPRFLEATIPTGLLPASAITVVSGPLAPSFSGEWPGITRLGPVQNLKENLHNYDLVVTHFGLTAFEAAWAGCAVLLLNPSPVHEKLSAAAGLRSLGVGRPDPRKLRSALENPAELARQSAAAAPAARLDAGEFLSSISPRHAGPCPACGRADGRALYRNRRKTYLRCPSCGLVRMAFFVKRDNPYTNTSYFFEEYKAQYGRTYLEDLPSIRLMAKKRLVRIESVLGRPAEDATVLDVGCAYGAFVAEAQQRLWHAVGSDLSEAAVEYVKGTFNVPAIVSDFSAPAADGLYPRELDCLTMWYVIEHFDELARVLRRVFALLKTGGVFAFSTPSCSGISARQRPENFWEQSPDDHFTVWDPKTVGATLARFGFTVKKIVVTGHHPERFSRVKDNPRSPVFMMAKLASNAFGLGDTFECYAVKTGNCIG